MNKVYKYTVLLNDYVEVFLPSQARILRVDTQDDGASNTIQIWALVDMGAPFAPRKLRIAGTGHPIQNSSLDLYYINTFTMKHGVLWFHAFEII